MNEHPDGLQEKRLQLPLLLSEVPLSTARKEQDIPLTSAAEPHYSNAIESLESRGTIFGIFPANLMTTYTRLQRCMDSYCYGT